MANAGVHVANIVSKMIIVRLHFVSYLLAALVFKYTTLFHICYGLLPTNFSSERNIPPWVWSLACETKRNKTLHAVTFAPFFNIPDQLTTYMYHQKGCF